MIKGIYILFFSCLFSSFHCQLDINKKVPIKQAPLYKYYAYTEAIGLINGFNINLEVNVNHQKFYADNVRVWLGIQIDNYFLAQHPTLQSKETYIGILFYMFMRRGKWLWYEFAPGVGLGHGDPIARTYLQSGYKAFRTAPFIVGNVGLRYTLKKVPINFRLSYLPLYDININKLYTFVASFSIGYSFKKINNEISKFKTNSLSYSH